MSEQAKNHTAHRARRAPARARLWAGRAMVAALALPCAAWTLGERAWAFDIVGNLAAHFGAVALLALLWRLARRRWGQAAGALACAAVALAPLTMHRAPRAGANDAARTVRLMTWNAHVDNPDAPGALRFLLDAPADVITLYEPSDDLLNLMRASDELRAKYPGYEIPDRAGAGWRMFLCAWPHERIRRGARDDERSHGRSFRVEHPRGGAFVVSMFHPASPRNADRWASGNVDVRLAIDAATGRLGELGLPLIFAGDFNATPSGARTRWLAREASLRRAKPLLSFNGTWPAWAPRPARVAIDDAMVSEGVGVVSWRTLRAAGSDHRPALTTLALP